VLRECGLLCERRRMSYLRPEIGLALIRAAFGSRPQGVDVPSFLDRTIETLHRPEYADEREHAVFVDLGGES
jgi:hypothetical protein